MVSFLMAFSPLGSSRKHIHIKRSFNFCNIGYKLPLLPRWISGFMMIFLPAVLRLWHSSSHTNPELYLDLVPSLMENLLQSSWIKRVLPWTLSVCVAMVPCTALLPFYLIIECVMFSSCCDGLFPYCFLSSWPLKKTHPYWTLFQLLQYWLQAPAATLMNQRFYNISPSRCHFDESAVL